MLPAFSKYIAICVPYLRNPFCRAGFTGRASQKPPPQGRFQGRGLAAFMPWQQETGTCLIFIRRPIHMPKKQTPPGSGQKGRPPWQAAVFRGGSWDILDFTVREGRAVYLQSGRTGGWENCRVFFLCRGTAPGRGGPPWQAAVRRRFRSWLLGWGVFHEEEGGVCPLSVSIKQ